MTILHEVQHAPTRVPRYVAPGSVADALDLLARLGPQARVVAGGTDLLVELDRGSHQGTEALVDISRLDELTGIDELDGGVIRLGAMVTHNDVVSSELCRRRLLPLAQACLEVGSPQLRNRATVVGNVVTASPANDTISALLALRASVEISSARHSRIVGIEDFITGFRTIDLEPDEMVTAVTVPGLGPNQRGVFVKAGLRRAQAISVVHLAVVIGLNEGLITVARAALGSVAPTVIIIPGLSEALAGRPLDDDTIAEAVEMASASATPIDDLRASADYRSAIVANMMQRALLALANGEQSSRWPDTVPLLAPARDDQRPSGSMPEPQSVDVDSAGDITATVNGQAVTARGAAGITLLDWLRIQPDLRGVKEGCAEGECGACTVLLDGAAIMSCLTPAGRADGCSVTTVEGLGGDGRLSPIQRAFIDTGAVQCGFCTPGFLVSCATLLSEIPEPDLEQLRLGLAGNLCRCTGYKAIESAVALAVGIRSEELNSNGPGDSAGNNGNGSV